MLKFLNQKYLTLFCQAYLKIIKVKDLKGKLSNVKRRTESETPIS
jgi:hypothetical protein